MRRVALHKDLLHHLMSTPAVNVWQLTSPSFPVSVIAFGRRQLGQPFGYMMIASQAATIFSAVEWITGQLEDREGMDMLAPDFTSVRHAVAFTWSSHTELAVEVRSSNGWASRGTITKPPHPEFPTEIDLLDLPKLTDHSGQLTQTMLEQLVSFQATP